MVQFGKTEWIKSGDAVCSRRLGTGVRIAVLAVLDVLPTAGSVYVAT
jgi:hypothetical protein